MNYNNFIAFIKNDTTYLHTYYRKNTVRFTDFMLALNNEFKNFFIEDNSRKNLTSMIIENYLGKNLSIEDRLLAESKYAYSLTHIGLNGLENNLIVKKVLSYYHKELTQHINNNLMEEFELTDLYKRQKRTNLKQLQILLSTIEPNQKQKKLPSSIRSLPEDMLDLRHNDLNSFFIDKRNMEILDTDLIVQIYHLPHNGNISENEFNNFISKTKKVRHKFADIKVESPNLSSLLSLINQDIVYGYFFNPLSDANSVELWNHIMKFNLDNIDSNFIKDDSESNRFLFVLTQNNELIISPFQQGDIHIRHIMLANGYPILTGGGIEFSKDMKKIISINNGTGHYKADFESLNLIRDKLINSKYDTSETVFIDVITDKRELLSDIKKIIDAIKEIRDESLLTSSSKPISSPN